MALKKGEEILTVGSRLRKEQERKKEFKSWSGRISFGQGKNVGYQGRFQKNLGEFHKMIFLYMEGHKTWNRII